MNWSRCLQALLVVLLTCTIGVSQDPASTDRWPARSTLDAVNSLARRHQGPEGRSAVDAVRGLAAGDADQQPQRDARAREAERENDALGRPARQPRRVPDPRGARQAARQDRVPGGWAPDPTIGFASDRQRVFSTYYGGYQPWGYAPGYPAYYPAYSLYYYPIVRYYGYDHWHPWWYWYQPPVATISAPVTIMYDDPLGRQHRTVDESIRRAAEDPAGRPR